MIDGASGILREASLITQEPLIDREGPKVAKNQ
jgi:hypothetical protein